MAALSEKQKEWLILHYKHTKNAEIAAKLGISQSYLHRLARSLGLKKTPQFMRKMREVAVAAAKIAIEKEDEDAREHRRQIALQNRRPFQKGVYVLAAKTEAERAEIQKKRVASWRETRRKDMIRLNWGYPMETNFRPPRDPDPKRQRQTISLRGYLRRVGYIIPDKGGMVVLIAPTTHRSDKMEQRAIKLGFVIRNGNGK